MKRASITALVSSLPVVMLMTLAVLGGCADPAATVRKVTYPPDFKYVSRSELKSAMGMLARDLGRLDDALSAGESGSQVDQQQVVAILDDIDRTVRGLDAASVGTNHPFLQDRMDQFVSDVGLARTAASLEPPRYYAAGKLAGGCVNCHRVNR